MSSPKAPTLIKGRRESIDALRGIAALGVVLYHAVLQTQNAVPWFFYRFCEKPYMRKPATTPEWKIEEPSAAFSSNVSIATEEA